jgi:hypothetical protein
MPLIHRKKPAAFKENVKEMVEHRKMASGGCMGPSCKGCSDPSCYAAGGEVKGVHEDVGMGMSSAGFNVREAKEGTKESQYGSRLHPDVALSSAKEKHHKVLSDMQHMKKPNLYANGGEVETMEPYEDKGVSFEDNRDKKPEENGPWPGTLVMKENKAEGGMVEDEDMDGELHHAMGGELMGALERKDRKGIMQAIEAIVLSMKHGE